MVCSINCTLPLPSPIHPPSELPSTDSTIDEVI